MKHRKTQDNRSRALPTTMYPKLAIKDTTAVPIYEVKLLALLFMRGLNCTQQFFMASKLDVGDCFNDIVYRYQLLAQEEWKTACVHLNGKDKFITNFPPNTSEKSELNFLKYFQGYSEIQNEHSLIDEIKSWGKFESFQFILFTNSSVENELEDRKEVSPECVTLFNTGDKDLVLTFDEGIDNDGNNKYFKSNFMLDKDGKEHEEITNPMPEDSKSSIENSKTCGSATQKELRTEPTANEANKEIKDKYDKLLRDLTIFHGESNHIDLDKLIKAEISKSLEINDNLSLNKISITLQEEVQMWWKNGSYYLNNTAPFWKSIILSRIEEYSENFTKMINQYPVMYTQRALATLNQAIPFAGMLNILVPTKGSDILTANKVYQTLVKFEDRAHIFVSMSDLINRKNEILRVWRNVYCGSLVVICESGFTDHGVMSPIFLDINKTLNYSKTYSRVIFITRTHSTVAGFQRNCNINLKEYLDDVSWLDVTEDTQTELLSRKVTFQGDEMLLNSLVDLKRDKILMNEINGEILEQLVSGKQKLSIGLKLKETIEHFISRRLKRDNKCSYSTTVINNHDKIVLVTAENGAGKSTLMTHLARSTKLQTPKKWITQVNLNDALEFLKDLRLDQINQDTVIDLISNFSINKGTGFEKEMLHHRLTVTGDILVYIDGVDKVYPYYAEKVFCILQTLMETEVDQIWVTSLLCEKEFLEKALKCKAFDLEPYNKADQRRFLKAYWQVNTTGTDGQSLDDFIDKLLELSEETFRGDQAIVSVPELTNMIVEYIEAYLEKYTTGNEKELKHDLFLLYNAFVHKKWEVYNTTNQDIDEIKDTETACDEESKHLYITRHAYAAIVLLLSSQELKDLDITRHDGNVFLTKIKERIIKTGIIDKVTNGVPHFIHQPLAEYFAAIWFAKNYKICQKIIIRRKFLDPGFNKIRKIFDQCLTNRFKLHTAVINQDIRQVKHLLSNENIDVDLLDEGGRSALHLAVAYGCIDRDCDYDNIINALLVSRASVELIDDVFQWQPLDYADQTESWKIAGFLMQSQTQVMEMKNAKKSMVTPVYEELVSYLSDSKSSHAKLLLASVKHGELSIVRYLVDLGVDVDASDDNGETALLTATRNGNLELMKYLLNVGADVNKTNKSGWCCIMVANDCSLDKIMLYLKDCNVVLNESDYKNHSTQKNSVLLCASYLGYLDLVQHQLKQGANINVTNNTGWSALLLASAQGHVHIMEYLLSKKAIFYLHSSLSYEQLNTSFLLASFMGLNNDMISRFAMYGVNLNVKTCNGWCALLLAMLNNKVRMVDLLLLNGALVDLKELSKMTDFQKAIALQVVAFTGDLKTVKELVEQQTSVTVKNNAGWSAPLLATLGGHIQIMEYFSQIDSKVCLTKSMSSNFANTCLVWMSFLGSKESIRELLDQHKADINVVMEGGLNPLMMASFQEHFECMEYLLSSGAKINEYKCFIYKQLNLALFCAALQGDVEMMDRLIKIGADIQAETKSCWNPLLISTNYGNIGSMNYLINLGAKVFKSSTCDYQLPYLKSISLICAAYQGDKLLIEKLIDQGADVNAVNKIGWNSLMYATNKGNKCCMDVLLGNGAGVRMEGFRAMTTLQKNVNLLIASFNGDVISAEILVNNGAEVNCSNQLGTTPLMYAVGNNSYQVVKFLVEKGASVHMCDNNGSGPLHQIFTACALDKQTVHGNVSKNKSDIATLLISREADPFAVNSNNKTPIDLARITGQEDLVNIVLSECLKVKTNALQLANTISEYELLYALLMTSNYGNIEYVMKFIVTKYNVDTHDMDYKTYCELLVNQLNQTRWSPVTTAAQNKQWKSVRLLVEHGADIETTFPDGRILLHYIVDKEEFLSKDVVSYLVNKGASVNILDADFETVLMRAVSWGSLKVVEQLIEHGANINDVRKDGRSALHIYVQRPSPNLQILHCLLNKKANVNLRDMEGVTPLMCAALGGSSEFIRVLIEWGADVNAVNEDGNTVLHYVTETDVPSLDVLSQFVSNVELINATNNNGISPLMNAAYWGWSEIVSYLIDNGASVNTLRNDWRSALFICMKRLGANADVLYTLLSKGAYVNISDNDGITPLMVATYINSLDFVEPLIKYRADVKAVNKAGISALHICVQSCTPDLQVLDILLHNEADVNLSDLNGITPLMCAVSNNSLKVVKILIEYGADITDRNKDGCSALHFCVNIPSPDLQLLHFLLTNGSDVNLKDNNGRTPLMSAVVNNSLKVVKILIEYGADITDRSKDGSSALHFCVNIPSPDLQLLHFLLTNGSDVNLKGINGRTPLMSAVVNNSLEVVKVLMENGAELTPVSNDGSSLIHFIVSTNAPSFDMLNLFFNKGIDFDVRDGKGLSPLMYATHYGSCEIVKCLLEQGANIKSLGNNGCSVLHCFFQRPSSNFDILELLVARGANVNACDKKGITPLMLAAKYFKGQTEYLELMLSNGADVNLRDVFGRSALDWIHKDNPSRTLAVNILRPQ